MKTKSSSSGRMLLLKTARLRAQLAQAKEIPRALREVTDVDAVLEAIPANVAVLDATGVILRVNQAWNSHASENGISPGQAGIGANYLAVCDMATGSDASLAKCFAAGIRMVIGGQRKRFSMEYPCHSPSRQRWFVGYVTATSGDGQARVLVAHVDITAQKVVGEQIRKLNEELESRVTERTAALQAAVDALETEIGQRRRLELEILEISEREKSRVGQDLHDGLCQTLAGIALIGKLLQRNLEEGKLSAPAAAADVEKIVNLVKEAASEARGLALGMYPVNIEEYGLALALEKFASDTARSFRITCKFAHTGPEVLLDNHAAAHLYRITQEAVSNAINHGRSGVILIKLAATGDRITLAVEDNGQGLLKDLNPSGMGLKTMKYRAGALGGSLEIRQRARRGLAVICSFPKPAETEPVKAASGREFAASPRGG